MTRCVACAAAGTAVCTACAKVTDGGCAACGEPRHGDHALCRLCMKAAGIPVAEEAVLNERRPAS